MSEAAFAMSVPVIPIENPTSAFIKAGASLVPSPVTATTAPHYCIPVTKSSLSSGEDRARTRKLFLISLNVRKLPTKSIFLPGFFKSSIYLSPPTAPLNSFPVIQVY